MENVITKAAKRKAAGSKAELLIDSAQYRAGLVQSAAVLTLRLRPESLIQNAVEHMVSFAGARLGASLAPSGDRYLALMPLAVAALSFLLRQKRTKLALCASAVAAIAFF